MQLTIVGATGGVGSHLLATALDAGHDIIAVVRNPNKLAVPVRAVEADLATAASAALETAVDGADAVLSCLGPRSNSDAGIAERATRSIIAAMQATTARRLVVISAAPVATVPSPGRPNPPRRNKGDGVAIGYLATPLLKAVLAKQYADLARMEDAVRDSGIDWTVLRPSRLTNGYPRGTYRTAVHGSPRHGRRISRADLATAMLRVVNDPGTVKRAIGIAY